MKSTIRAAGSRFVATLALNVCVLAQVSGAVPSPRDEGAHSPVPRVAWRQTSYPRAIVPPRAAGSLSAIAVDLEVLRTATPGQELSFDLGVHGVHRAAVERVASRGEASFSISGSLPEIPGSWWLMAFEKDAVAAQIAAPAVPFHYVFRYLGQSIHLLTELLTSELPGCQGAAPRPVDVVTPDFVPEAYSAQEHKRGEGGEAVGCSEPQPVFDAMIVYTNLARDAAGGTNAINSECQLAVDSVNLIYARSNINARYRLVWRGEVQYDEKGTYSDHLTRLSTAWGVFALVLGTRDVFNADFLTLWVNDSEFCGKAWCGGVSEPEAFSVVTWNCAAANYSQAHEIGHNQGCAHDRDNAEGCAAFANSYGYRFDVNETTYRTVMAYPPGLRIANFSDPNVQYLEHPTGTVDEWNASAIRAQSRHCEDLQVTRMDIWVDFSHPGTEFGIFVLPFNTIAEGLDNLQQPGPGASETPNLYIKQGTTSWVGTIDRPMWIRACGGPVSLGQ